MLNAPRLQFIYSTKPMYTIITIICSQALCSSCILLLTLIITGLICLAKEANAEMKTVQQVARKKNLHKQYQSCRFRLSIIWKDVRIWKVSFIFCIDFLISGYSYCLQHISENSLFRIRSSLIISQTITFFYCKRRDGFMQWKPFSELLCSLGRFRGL